MVTRVRVVFEDLAKRYDMRLIFKGLSGEAAPGEVLLITGPNGSGKSTLMTILCGLLSPTRGRVRYLSDGNEEEVPRSEWRRHIGVVAPAMSVYEELTAMENLRFFARVRGLGRSTSIDARCRQLLESVGLDWERRTPLRGYSTGMHQRVKIAQAMLHQPEVLFLDEPGASLDEGGRQWLADFVGTSAGAGRTVLLATNDQREMEWGDRRVGIRD
jgi:heme exporter protein A